jgi:predicted aspartyl protease
MNKVEAFTVNYPDLVNCIRTTCGICKSFNPDQEGAAIRHVLKFKALWDTGATGCVISSKVVGSLKLIPIGKAKVFHANGESIVNIYSVDIVLSEELSFDGLIVTEGILPDIDVLIGMDIISQGDFAITASRQKTKFSFQVPSTHDTDYVKENE